jgi:hypothetical protein
VQINGGIPLSTKWAPYDVANGASILKKGEEEAKTFGRKYPKEMERNGREKEGKKEMERKRKAN